MYTLTAPCVLEGGKCGSLPWIEGMNAIGILDDLLNSKHTTCMKEESSCNTSRWGDG